MNPVGLDLNNVLLYSTSAAAQVWAALLVFQVLLVRDQKASIDREIDDLWKQARYWWKGLIQSLRNDNLPNLGDRLGDFGLDKETVDRAETDRKCFKKIMKETHARKIILNNEIQTVTLNRALTPDTFQGTMDPIAERLIAIEKIEHNPRIAFLTGLTAIVLNMTLLLSLGPLLKITSHETLVGTISLINFVAISFFGFQTWKSFDNN